MGSARRVIAILGAGGTLGTALSRKLAAEPDTDLVLSDLSEDALSVVTGRSWRRAPGQWRPCGPTSATSPQVEQVVKHAVDRFGRLDVLISNAGVLSPNGRIHNLGTEDWERAFRINVLGPVNGIRAAVPVMRAQRSGSIILTASVAGLTAWSHSSPYCVTKAGVIQLAKVAAVEYARDGIRVNCVCPGTFLSAMHAGLPPRRWTPSRPSTRSASARPTTWSAPTPTWRATRRAGRRDRRSSSTAATRPPKGAP